MPIYGFLYFSESETDEGYREVAGLTYGEARAAWQAEVEAEGLTGVRLDAAQVVPAVRGPLFIRVGC